MADLPRALLADIELTPGARLVAVALWTYADHGLEPFVWPSTATLAEVTGQIARSVRRSLAALKGRGWISRTSRVVGAKPVRRMGWALARAVGSDLEVDSDPEVPSDTPIPVPWDPEVTPDPEVDSDRGGRSPRTAQAVPSDPITLREPTITLDDDDVWFRVDQVRREIERETDKTIGPLSRRSDRLDALPAALAELGLDELLEVVRHRCRRVAWGLVEPVLWRTLFAGDGWQAAREELDRHRRNREAEAARETQELADQISREANALTAERAAELAADLPSK